MRGTLPLALLAILPFFAGATAQAEAIGDDVFVVKGDSLAATPMAAWEHGGAVHGASGTDSAAAPNSAVRYEMKSVAWPTATVKVISFSAATGGVLHPLTDETLLYVKQGSVQATVAGEQVTLNTGDVASLPAGALTNPGAPSDATVVAWTAASLTPDATPAVVRAQDVPTSQAGGGLLSIRRYEFPGNSVRAVTLAKGLVTNPNTAPSDSMIYVTAGPMQFFQDGQEFEVTEGDFIREIAHLMHNWNVTENSGFVTTSALPIGAAPIDPSRATDRPQ